MLRNISKIKPSDVDDAMKLKLEEVSRRIDGVGEWSGSSEE